MQFITFFLNLDTEFIYFKIFISQKSLPSGF